MIIVRKRPYDYCTSGNPIAYELYSALAEDNADVYFEVRIMFTYAHNVFFALLVEFPVYPVNGTAAFDIKDFLDGKLEHGLPEFDVDEKLATAALSQTGLFYIEFREILTAGSDPTWNESESEYQKVVIKAGLSYFKYRGDNFWINYFNDNNPFLTWQRSGRLARLQDRQYLTYFNNMQLPSWAIPEVVGPDLFASAKAYYTDGTESARQYKEVENNSENMVNYIPAGADQWELQLLAPAKRILKWDIQMYYTSASDGTKTALNEPYYFYADNRNDYKNVMLQFRNSLGGLDGLLVRGVIDHNLNYEFDEQARTFLADYFSGDYITPARIIANSRENKIFKGDVGPLTKEDQERIRDLNLERNAWWEIDDKWWPVNILTQNVKQKTTEDDRWSFPIEFSFAQHGDKYYTPDAIALGDRTFATNVCEAELTNITTEVDTSGPTASVQIDFDYTLGLLQFSYQIVGVHEDPVVANTGDLPITVNDLPLDATYALKLRPICSNGVIGRVFNAGFNTIGEGGTGGGGSGESEITNESGIDIETCVITSDGDEIYNGSLPAGITDLYTAPDETDVDVEVTIGFMPSACKLVSDGVEYWGIPKPAGAEFHHVTITGGMIITIY